MVLLSRSVSWSARHVSIPNGYDYSAAAAGRFYAACIHRITLPYIAAVIMLLLDAGG